MFRTSNACKCGLENRRGERREGKKIRYEIKMLE